MNDFEAQRSALLEKARKLPKAPGVYLMKDKADVVLYVGKASILPNRVSSYFQKSVDLGPKKQQMLPLIIDFDYIECESEWEALLTENRLIKDLHPKYNARLTDDKSFPYLVITMRDDYPGVYITRNPGDPDFKGAKIFGPFISGYALRDALKILQRGFRFRTCELTILESDEKKKYFRPCLLYPIKQCTAPCADKISKEAYREDIKRLIRFMESKRSVMLRELKQEMETAAANMDYENAAAIRDQIIAIEKLDERGSKHDGWQPKIESFYVDPAKGLTSLQRTLKLDNPIRWLECIDIAHLQGESTVGSKVCFVDGRPLKNEYRRYKIKTVKNDDYAAIQEVVSRGYRDAGANQQMFPDVIIIDGGLGQLNAALEAFADFQHQPPMVISLAKKEELIFKQNEVSPIRLGRDNLGLKLCQAIRDEAHRFAQSYHHLLRKKKVLDED